MKCPHYEKLLPLTEAMDESDVIILASPVYVYHVTGAMKTFLDHYGYRWMVHRPEEKMFLKQGVCISTAAGGGMKSANKDMDDSFFYWGVPKVHKYGIAVQTTNWNIISEKKKNEIDKATTSLAQKIINSNGRVKPRLKTKVFFNVMRFLLRKGWNESDVNYWNENGWLGSKRPWR